MDRLLIVLRRLPRIILTAFEAFIGIVTVVLLLALVRQMLTMTYLVMGHDTDVWLEVARKTGAGLLPYRDFNFEYPPLGFLAIVLPFVLWIPGVTNGATYAALLALENVIVVALTAACLVWLARRGWSAHSPWKTVALYLMLVGATPILFWRFDAFAALFSTLGLMAFASSRFAVTGLAVAAGALTKLYTVTMLPVLALESVIERNWRAVFGLLSGSVGPIAVSLAITFAGAGWSAPSFFGYYATQGVQLESVPASIVLIAHVCCGTPAVAYQGVGAWQLESPLIDELSWLWPLLAVICIAALCMSAVASFRSERHVWGSVRPQTYVEHLVAAILVAMLSYRLLSPQYIVWLLPLAALLATHRTMLVLAVSALTLSVYPFGYEALVNLQPDGIFALALRNALLAGLFIWLVGPGVWLAATGRRPRMISIGRGG
jgi:hypothetical protein